MEKSRGSFIETCLKTHFKETNLTSNSCVFFVRFTSISIKCFSHIWHNLIKEILLLLIDFFAIWQNYMNEILILWIDVFANSTTQFFPNTKQSHYYICLRLLHKLVRARMYVWVNGQPKPIQIIDRNTFYLHLLPLLLKMTNYFDYWLDCA